MRIADDQARALVRARLGREPADFLESAVVLEAWGGLRAPAALDAAPTWQPERGAVEQPPAPRVQEPTGPRQVGWLIVATVFGTALYLLLLNRHLPGALVDRAWRASLPCALGAQWVIRRRYLTGRRSLVVDARLLSGTSLAACTGAALGGGEVGQVVVLIVLPWCAASLVIGTRFAVAYAGALALAAVTGLVVPSALIGAVLPSVVAIAAVAHAMRTELVTARPAPWSSALPLGVTGFALGLVIVSVPGVSGPVRGLVAVVALLPTLLGNHVAGLRLRRIWHDGAAVDDVVAQALALLTSVAVVCSAAVAAGAALVGDDDLRPLVSALALLFLVAVLTFPLLLVDAFRFDGVLLALGVATVAIMATGLEGPQALAATLVTFGTSVTVMHRLLRDGSRLRALPA